MRGTNTQWPRCPECGGRVTMRGGEGRTREYKRAVHLAIPDDFLLPTCERCHEILMAPEVSEPLDALLEATYREQLRRELQVCVDVLRDRHGVTQQDIEDACSVTRSYLSHLLSGRKEPSLMLMKLLRTFVLAPDAFEHARTNQPLPGYLAGLFAVPSPQATGKAKAGDFVQRADYRRSERWSVVESDTRLAG